MERWSKYEQPKGGGNEEVANGGDEGLSRNSVIHHAGTTAMRFAHE